MISVWQSKCLETWKWRSSLMRWTQEEPEQLKKETGCCAERPTWKPDRGLVIHHVWPADQCKETQTCAHVSCLKSRPRVGRHRARRAARALLSCNLQGGSALGLDAFVAPPEPRGLGGHLGFPKIWVAKEMRSRRQPEQSRAGRAEWHSWFPLLWTDYCCLSPTAWCTAQCTAQLT